MLARVLALVIVAAAVPAAAGLAQQPARETVHLRLVGRPGDVVHYRDFTLQHAQLLAPKVEGAERKALLEYLGMKWIDDTVAMWGEWSHECTEVAPDGTMSWRVSWDRLRSEVGGSGLSRLELDSRGRHARLEPDSAFLALHGPLGEAERRVLDSMSSERGAALFDLIEAFRITVVLTPGYRVEAIRLSPEMMSRLRALDAGSAALLSGFADQGRLLRHHNFGAWPEAGVTVGGSWEASDAITAPIGTGLPLTFTMTSTLDSVTATHVFVHATFEVEMDLAGLLRREGRAHGIDSLAIEERLRDTRVRVSGEERRIQSRADGLIERRERMTQTHIWWGAQMDGLETVHHEREVRERVAPATVSVAGP